MIFVTYRVAGVVYVCQNRATLKYLISFLLLILSFSLKAQELEFKAKILDAESKEQLIGATAIKTGSSLGASADINGELSFKLSSGAHELRFSFLGYKDTILNVNIPQSSILTVLLRRSEESLDEIIVEGTRSNRSIANIPTRTEVLTEEIDEAASMEPSRISHLLTHSTGVQVQTTSASSNGAVVRIQGLNGRYTQLLKDGFILYGGFSGSIDIMQIPPLDLRQVEFIKGPNSTLYGGGAISGIINLLSKTPDKEENLIHLNVSSIGSYDFNSFISKKIGNWGITNLSNLHVHDVYDADDDGYSDVPNIRKINLNPKVFYNSEKGFDAMLGLNLTQETRNAGDLDLVKGLEATALDFYSDFQESSRITSQLKLNYKVSSRLNLQFKNSLNRFDREIRVREDAIGNSTEFGGIQRNSYSELTGSFRTKKLNIVLGVNHLMDRFNEQFLGDSFLGRTQNQQTYGAFTNGLWDLSTKFILEAGFRYDLVQVKSDLANSEVTKAHPLPKLSLLYKVNDKFSIRSSGSYGYRMPSLFSEEAEPLAYKLVQSINYKRTTHESSRGVNLDFKYLSDFNSRDWLFSFNQIFFANIIDNPIFLIRPWWPFDADNPIITQALGQVNLPLQYQNIGEQVESRGFESQLKLTYKRVTLFLGYTYTDVYLVLPTTTERLTQVPFHNLKGDVLYSLPGKWRIGLDYEYDSPQRLSNNTLTPSLFSSGVIVERTIDNLTVFLNAENFTDTRQTRFESLLTAPNNTPQYTQVYAPLEGFYINLGLKIRL